MRNFLFIETAFCVNGTVALRVYQPEFFVQLKFCSSIQGCFDLWLTKLTSIDDPTCCLCVWLDIRNRAYSQTLCWLSSSMYCGFTIWFCLTLVLSPCEWVYSMFTDKFNSLQIKLTHVEHSNTEAAQMLSLLVQKILQ